MKVLFDKWQINKFLGKKIYLVFYLRGSKIFIQLFK